MPNITKIDLSVIIPIYNPKEEYLEECLKSITNQKLENIEFILFLDGCNKFTKEICYKYKNQDSRIVIHKQENKCSRCNESKNIWTFLKGEETIFMKDLLDNGFNIYSVDKQIGYVHDEESNWFTGFDDKYLYDQGAIFYKMFPKEYKLLIIQYLIRKHSLYKTNLNIVQAYKQMINGAKEVKIRMERES